MSSDNTQGNTKDAKGKEIRNRHPQIKYLYYFNNQNWFLKLNCKITIISQNTFILLR